MIQEYTVFQAELSRGLGMALHGISSKPMKAIYAGVSAVAETGKGLTLTATDGETTVRTVVDADIQCDGATVYPAKLFSELVRRQNSGDIRVSVDDKNTAKITIGGSKTNMACMNHEYFPKIADIEDGQAIQIPCGKLKDAIGRTMFAVSTDEARKILTGILMEFHPDHVRLVSIDGFRMAVVDIPVDNGPSAKGSIVIPGRFMAELSKILPDDESLIDVEYNTKRACFNCGDDQLYVALLQGEFIDYGKLLPNGANTTVMVNRDRLYAAIDRCGLMAREAKSNLITMNVSGKEMVLSSRAERGDTYEHVDVLAEGEPVKISFDARFLTDAVRYAGPEEISMTFRGSVSPMIIQPKDVEVYTYLVLPVRTIE